MVSADWSGLSGAPAAEIAATDLAASWRDGPSGLTVTQHLIGNQQVNVNGDTASASAYVHAAHRLAADYAGQVWVVAGRYDYQLIRIEARWLINAAAFKPAWGWGNQHVMDAAGRAEKQ